MLPPPSPDGPPGAPGAVPRPAPSAPDPRDVREEVRPDRTEIAAAFERAVGTGRGLTGTPRAAVAGAAGRRLLAGAAGCSAAGSPAAK